MPWKICAKLLLFSSFILSLFNRKRVISWHTFTFRQNLRIPHFKIAFCIFRLVERIEEISLKEDMTIDNGTLHCIAEKSECDIRSCLSTMQFIKQKDGKITHSFLSQLGTKDKSKGLFGVWEDLFFLPQAYEFHLSKNVKIFSTVTKIFMFTARGTMTLQIQQEQKQDLAMCYALCKTLVITRNSMQASLRITLKPSFVIPILKQWVMHTEID